MTANGYRFPTGTGLALCSRAYIPVGEEDATITEIHKYMISRDCRCSAENKAN